MIDVLLGLQWGDEGKGKLVDFLSPKYDLIARYQGGPNAGHTIYLNHKKIVLHQVPSGVLHPSKKNLIGGCVVLDPIIFFKELALLKEQEIDVLNNIILAENISLIMPTHQLLDQVNEEIKGIDKIGSTLKGIGPAYMDKSGRFALKLKHIFYKDFKEQYLQLRNRHLSQISSPERFKEILEEKEKLFFEAIEKLRECKIVNIAYYTHNAIKAGAKILAEGAQGSMLDIDLGTYPFVTSSTTLSSGLCSSLGVAPQMIKEVIGVSKGYCTRVGNGPFPSEISDKNTEEFLRKVGHEFGATTGRPRRCGWLDLVALKYACIINGVTQLMLTKMDVLDHFEEIKICYEYDSQEGIVKEFPYGLNALNKIKPVLKSFSGWNSNIQQCKDASQLPDKLKSYVSYIETELDIKVSALSNGVNQQDIIKL
ncbi:MAG: adenylosuccinate synthase [Sediminibacterium sp.]|nr:adenylosuccinate synthase [Sediminibacterium sp.]